jgi:DNA-binding response OmpR family regulator
MEILIVEANCDLGRIWQRHLQRFCFGVDRVTSSSQAIDRLQVAKYSVVIIGADDAVIGSISLTNVIGFRSPTSKVIFVSNDQFFSDGSIYQLLSNDCIHLPANAKPEDICAYVSHYSASY